MRFFKDIRVFAICLLVVVAGNAIAAPEPPVFLPNITEPPYTGPTVIELRPPPGYTIYGGADVSSIRLSDGSICWATTIIFPDKSFRVRVFKQVGDNVAIEQRLDKDVVGRGTLDRDDDGVVLTAVEDTRAFRIYVPGCNT